MAVPVCPLSLTRPPGAELSLCIVYTKPLVGGSLWLHDLYFSSFAALIYGGQMAVGIALGTSCLCQLITVDHPLDVGQPALETEK